jgi:hypothetical protein
MTPLSRTCFLGGLALAALPAVLPGQETRTAPPDSLAAIVVARGRTRHLRQDSLVQGYQVSVQTRFEMVAGRSRFARLTTLLAHESAARVRWRAPNDLKIEILGTRTALPLLRMLRTAGVKLEDQDEAELDRPWFVPRSLGDSIRLMGVPEIGALHPLAPGADAFYDYALTDSIVLELPDRTVHAMGVRVTPRQPGPSLVAGDLWLDEESGDLVRLRVLFVGEFLWERPQSDVPGDSARARRDNRRAQRYVAAEADLEYALHGGRFWLPHRQSVFLTLRVPFFTSATIPIRAVTTFQDYDVNPNAALAFSIAEHRLPDETRRRRAVRVCFGCSADSAQADSLEPRAPDSLGYHRGGRWGNGRWEVSVPPAERLRAYDWPAPMIVETDPATERRFAEAAAALARLAEDLPDDVVGRRRFGVAWERAADVFRFNRVEGASLGLGYSVRPSMPFTSVNAVARFGLSDHRLTGSLTWRWDGPEARVDVVAYRSVQEVEPWHSPGFGGSLNAVFAGHDDADYYLAHGGGFGFTPNHGPLGETRISVMVEKQASMVALARSSVNDALGGDGLFPWNPPVKGGFYLRAAATRSDRLGPLELRHSVDLLTGDGGTALRGWGSLRVASGALGYPVVLGVTGGAVVGDELPQMQLRVGGPRTVRGYDYGTRAGARGWAAQLDAGLRRHGVLMPMVFADVGNVTGGGRPLVGVGAGLSVLAGLLRFDVSRGLSPTTELRFDMGFRALW